MRDLHQDGVDGAGEHGVHLSVGVARHRERQAQWPLQQLRAQQELVDHPQRQPPQLERRLLLLLPIVACVGHVAGIDGVVAQRLQSDGGEAELSYSHCGSDGAHQGAVLGPAHVKRHEAHRLHRARAQKATAFFFALPGKGNELMVFVACTEGMQAPSAVVGLYASFFLFLFLFFVSSA